MCTAMSFNNFGHYFGRNLDLEHRYDENIVITPRNYIFKYKSGEIDRKHYAIIGTATVIDGYPLYYDATNEHGLSIAGLNFVGNAYLNKKEEIGKINLAPYELIPYILGKCKSVYECIKLLKIIVLVDIRFADGLPNSELHWLISDKHNCITFEYMVSGVKIYDNAMGILTNNPPFDYHLMNLNNYMQLSDSEPHNNLSDKLSLNAYSRGMGAIGLPGDNSSTSRFIRCCFNKLNSVHCNSEIEAITQFFHILSSVEQVEGSVKIDSKYERTQYSSCCDIDKGIYYYKTYENNQINAVSMHNENIETDDIIRYPMILQQNIYNIN